MRTSIFLLCCLFSLFSSAQKEPPFGLKCQEVDLPGSESQSIHCTFKVPSSGLKVNEEAAINCKGWIPDDARITSITIDSIENLPENYKWRCPDKTCNYKGGKTGTLYFNYSRMSEIDNDIIIHLRGAGSYFLIEKEYNCRLTIKQF